jgi:hypothetical protein
MIVTEENYLAILTDDNEKVFYEIRSVKYYVRAHVAMTGRTALFIRPPQTQSSAIGFSILCRPTRYVNLHRRCLQEHPPTTRKCNSSFLDHDLGGLVSQSLV